MRENFCIGARSFSGISSQIQLWHTRYIVRHGHFTLKQLRLSVLNEMPTNSYRGPRLEWTQL